MIALVAAFSGVALDLLLVLSAGGGLSGGYIAGVVGAYLFYGSVAVIGVGTALAVGAQRSAGVVLTLVAALFEIGFLIGSQLSRWLLIIPSRT